MARARLVIDKAGISRLVRTPSSPVGKHLGQKGELLASLMRQEAPVRTGALRDSIHATRPRTNISGELQVSVRIDAPHAIFVIKGTRPHTIEAVGDALRFEAGGSVIYRKRVSHPGTRPNDFVKRAMRAMHF